MSYAGQFSQSGNAQHQHQPLEYNSNLSYYSNPSSSHQPSQSNQQPSSSSSSFQSNNASYNQIPQNYSGNMLSSSVDPYGSVGGAIASSTSLSSSSFAHSDGGIGLGFDDEPPLLEELGIHPQAIISNTLAVSMPWSNIKSQSQHLAEADLAGPLVFCFFLGFFLLLSGKFHFGYIFGFGLIGCSLMYALLNLMSDTQISFQRTMSVLGYSLLPIVLLSAIAIIIELKKATIGLIISAIICAWCTFNAVRLFDAAIDCKHQKWLIAYPTSLLYACFALLTIF